MTSFLVHVCLLIFLSQEVSGRFSKCGFTSDLNFAPWGASFDTDLPTIFPKSEPELVGIIAKARTNNCRVRPVGATHSVSGIVAHKAETNVVTVNLADVSVPAFWNFEIDEEKLVVRAPAGASLFDLQRFIRPKGYLLPTTTASPLFALGGVFLTPSVHGSTIAQDRCTTLLMGVRAILANGRIVEERGESAMHKWRGSLGFLGLVTAVEVRIRRDTGIKFSKDRFKVTPWTREKHTSLFLKSIAGFDSVQYFWNTYTDLIIGNRGDFDGDPSFNVPSTTVTFDELAKSYDGIQRKGRTNPLQKAIDVAAKAATGRAAVAAQMAAVSLGLLRGNDSPRDNYSYDLESTFFNDQIEGHIPCKSDCIQDGTLFGVMDVTRNYLREASSTNKKFPTSPVTFRFLTVSRDDVFLLNYLPKGRYLAIEFTVQKGQDDRDQEFAPFLREIENLWQKFTQRHTARRLQYHTGKEWGYGDIVGLPRPYPFQSDVIARNFFTDAQRSEFLKLANQYDPNGVFRAGELGRMLGISTAKFEPRRVTREESQGASTSCKTFGNMECLSKCCCKNLFSCRGGGFRKCTISGIASGNRCKVNCSCASGICLFNRCSDEPLKLLSKFVV